MTKHKNGHLNRIIIFLLVASIIAFLIIKSRYGYPKYFTDGDYSKIEYNGHTYLRYEDDMWDLLTDTDYYKQIGYGETWRDKIYTFKLDDENKLIVLKTQKRLLEDMDTRPTLYYREDIDFDNPSGENVKELHIRYFENEIFDKQFYIEDLELIKELFIYVNEENQIEEFEDTVVIYLISCTSVYDENIQCLILISKLASTDSYMLELDAIGGYSKYYKIPKELIEKLEAYQQGN